MYVCICNQVNETQFAKDEEARESCGTVCGCCQPTVDKLLEDRATKE